jgi:hypothetical protein
MWFRSPNGTWEAKNAGKASEARTGATGVRFNGAAAAFAVMSATESAAQVLTGAATVKIQVVTPGGTLSSNVAFVVLP